MKKELLYTALLCFILPLVSYAQTENTSTVVDWRQHNLNKYNRMLVNPAYSIVREDQRAISFWSRIQWTGVNNSPQTFLINYSGKIGPSSGAGMGLYQQNLGLLTDSGILMNYAYEVKLGASAGLTLGINSTLFRRGLNKNAITSAVPDPTVLENQDDFLWLFMPGLNLRLGAFDLGVYAENLFDYNLNESRTVTGFDNKIYSAQLGFSHTFKNSYGVFGGASWRSLAYVKTLPNKDTQYGGSSMIDLSRFGWLQMGYNSTYGINGAVGVKLGDGMSVGVIYERGTDLTGSNFGPTYEAMATIELGSRSRRSRWVANDPSPTPEEKPEPAVTRVTETKDTPGREKEGDARVVQTGAYTIYGGTPVQSGPAVADDAGQNREEEPVLESNGVVADILDEMQEDDLHPVEAIGQKAVPAAAHLEEGVDEHPGYVKEVIPTVDHAMVNGDGGAPVEIAEKRASKAVGPVVSRDVLGPAEGYETMEVSQGIEKGFYLVVNVFSRERYFREFKDELQSSGLEPQYFVNPDNDYYYVYLAYADNYYRVKQLQRSHLQGRYKKDKWVLWIK